MCCPVQSRCNPSGASHTEMLHARLCHTYGTVAKAPVCASDMTARRGDASWCKANANLARWQGRCGAPNRWPRVHGTHTHTHSWVCVHTCRRRRPAVDESARGRARHSVVFGLATHNPANYFQLSKQSLQPLDITRRTRLLMLVNLPRVSGPQASTTSHNPGKEYG